MGFTEGVLCVVGLKISFRDSGACIGASRNESTSPSTDSPLRRGFGGTALFSTVSLFETLFVESMGQLWLRGESSANVTASVEIFVVLGSVDFPPSSLPGRQVAVSSSWSWCSVDFEDFSWPFVW